MSIQLQGNADFINVSRGLEPGASRLQKNGYNPGIAQTLVTVWNEATTMTFPAAATVMTLSSSSANDTAAGTGARTVTINGLNSSYVTTTEVVTLNGTTGVSTTNSFLRINSLSVATAGSGGSNAGIIYIGTGVITAGKPATIYGSIAAGVNLSRQAFHTIPSGSTGYLLSLLASTDTAGTQVQVYTRTQTGLFVLNRIFQLGIGAGTVQDYQLPLALQAGTDIEARATVASGTAKVAVQLEILVLSPN